jgi:hypothetical protein
MRTLPAWIGAVAAAALLSSCAYDGHYHGGGYAAAGVDYDGYYDDFYGPIGDGYWGPDDFFYYSNGSDHQFHRDDAHHFRHDAVSGFHPVHGHHAGPVPGAEHGMK